jgi:hypothetical protein
VPASVTHISDISGHIGYLFPVSAPKKKPCFGGDSQFPETKPVEAFPGELDETKAVEDFSFTSDTSIDQELSVESPPEEDKNDKDYFPNPEDDTECVPDSVPPKQLRSTVRKTQ